MATNRILTFQILDRDFGLDIAQVREIIPCREVTPVPNGPDFLLGVVNLRGEVIPIIDPAVYFGGSEPTPTDGQSCFIIGLIRHHQTQQPAPVGIVVHRIGESYQLNDEDIDPPPHRGSHVEVHYLAGVGRTPDGVKLLLNLSKLFHEHQESILDSLKSDAASGPHDSENSTDATPGESDPAEQRMQVLAVRLGELEFGVLLDEVTRVMQVSELTSDHLAPAYVAGVMSYAGQQLAIINTARKMGDETTQAAATGFIMVVEYNGMPVGFQMDAIGALHYVNASELTQSDSYQEMMADRPQSLGFIRDADETLEVVSLKRCLSVDETQEVFNWKKTSETLVHLAQTRVYQADQKAQTIPPEYHRLAGSYLVVRVGEHLLGLPVAAVEEVLAHQNVIALPKAQPDCAGILYLRGHTYPVMDLCPHFDWKLGERDLFQERIILVCDQDRRVGLIVQEVVELCEIVAEQIRPAGDCPAEIHAHLMTGAAQLNGTIAGLIKLSALIEDAQPSLLGEYEKMRQQAKQPSSLLRS